MNTLIRSSLIFSLFGVVACGGDLQNPAGPFTETVVILHGDEAPEVTVVTHVGVQPDISTASCGIYRIATPPIFLCDNVFCNGNRACFAGKGTIDLSTIPRGVGNNWAYSTQAYNTGYEYGNFSGTVFSTGDGGTLGPPRPCTESFVARKSYQAGFCAQSSWYLTLSN